jgi:midasin
MLLAERVRRDQERLVVKQVIEKVMKVKIDENSLYDMSKLDPQWTMESSLIWTKAMRRLFVLVTQALVNNEPILLVGETGSGKTTVCQVLAERMRKELHIINAHQNTETGDIIGGQRPYRDRLHYQSQLVSELRSFFSDRPETSDMALDDLAEEFSKLDVERLLASSNNPDHVSASIDKIRNTFNRQKILFEWVDGALVQAMKQGEPFLLDEISLADDSVLERLNSVLESSRSIVLAEKGGDDVHITATGGFQFFATMNPGGDYGKKELSPALRNRFTEIWVPAVEEHDDLVQIVKASLVRDIGESEFIVNFAEWFTKRIRGIGATISIRDILAWVQMVNVMYKSLGISLSLFHGAMMVYVDGIGATSGTEFLDISKEKARCVAYLSELLHHEFTREYASIINSSSTDYQFTLGHFSISKGVHYGSSVPFSFQSPTTAANGMKVLRAMQLPKPILLEGAPGIGKTSLISAIASAACRHLTRINLSDQTDLMDLFGSDVPVEGGRGGEFAWRDAPFLRAMQNGDWVLLDELNLASQSVLEGLNACLDHRGTAYIPELNRSFARHRDFRVFAAQNPHAQGGGRKGLPKSFVNRFSVVYVDSLTIEDMCVIGSHLFPSIEKETVRSLIKFIASVQKEANSNSAFASLGRPWEFNLRDSLRWLELVQDQEGLRNRRSAADYLHLVISQRLRSVNDKKHLASLFEYQVGPLGDLPSTYSLGIDTVQIGLALIRRNNTTVFKGIAPRVTTEQLQTMEILALCVEKGWPCLVVGSSGSGKTSMIRSLASMVGASCKEFSMNSDTDATDIIGGYEQRDLNRQICELINCLRDLLVGLLASTDRPHELSIYTRLLSILSTHSLANYDASALVSQFREFMEGLNLPMNLDVIIHRLHDMLIELVEESGTGKFQWYDGILVNALTHGSWIIFDNANLCNPSVLDRLNSLLEPEGSLILHEFTNARGEPRQIKPHPKFRLFLTMDPRHGELSRAMRNRAVEVAVEKKSYETTADGVFSFY